MSGNVYVNTKNQAIHATNKSALITVAGMVPNVNQNTRLNRRSAPAAKRIRKAFVPDLKFFLNSCR